MKIFIDSANIEEIKKIAFLIDGVTTNPSLIKSAADALGFRNMEEYIREICKTAGKGKPVSLEVVSMNSDAMIKEAEILYEKFNAFDNVVVKIPISTIDERYSGLKAMKALKEKGIPVNATLVMTSEQALLAKDASYVSPFAGRVDDYIRKNAGMGFEKSDYFPAEGIARNNRRVDDNGIYSGADLVRRIVKIYKNYDINTRIIAASLRNARQVREVAEAGAHIATIPFAVINEMITHAKTEEGIIKFSEDSIEEYKALFRE